MKKVKGWYGALLGLMIQISGCNYALAGALTAGSPVAWQQPSHAAAENATGQKRPMTRARPSRQGQISAGGVRGGSAMLPGAAGPALGLIYHKKIKCLDRPHPPKNGC
jgi:hypothetical protein